MADSIYGGTVPVFSGLPGFDIFGIMSPKRRDFLQAEAERSQAVVADVFEATGMQLQGLDSMAATPEQMQQVQTLRTRMGAIERMAASGNPKLAELGMAEYAKLNDDIDALSTNLAAASIARETAAENHNDALRTETLKNRGEMFKTLDPIQVALDSFKAINEVTEIDSPFALTAAAYKTVMLLQQGTGSRISDADLEAAQSGITTWAGWLEQQLATGAGGEGFTAEARNGLLKVLQPLARIASDQAAQTIGRYGALADAAGYDRGLLFAGLDEQLYRMPAAQMSPLPTAEEAEAAEAERVDALTSTGESVSASVRASVGGFLRGLMGFSTRERALEDLEQGRVTLTEDAQAAVDELGGPEALRQRIQEDDFVRKWIADFESKRKQRERERMYQQRKAAKGVIQR